MNVTNNETDEDWLILLDFEPDIPCESVLGCDNPADWFSKWMCCGDVYYLCNPCFEKCTNTNKGQEAIHTTYGHIGRVEWKRL